MTSSSFAFVLLFLFSAVAARNKSLAIGTRFFGQKHNDLVQLVDWISSVRNETDAPIFVAIAVNLDQLNSFTTIQEIFPDSDVHVIAVDVWGYSTALNSIVLRASQMGFDVLFFVSREVHFEKEHLTPMFQHLKEDTLVVGLSLPGHRFSEGSKKLDALSVPWNTCAIWDLKKLAKTGFLMCAEKFQQDDPEFGMEEVPAVSFLQQVIGTEDAKAKLLLVDGIEWGVDFSDPERLAKHKQKMKSKLKRGDAQLKCLKLERGIVQHIVV